MTSRLTALLVHGMANAPSWWDPFIPRLARLGIDCRPLPMPSLEQGGPESWVDEVLRQETDSPTILIGHSLGAAVCVAAALRRRFEGLLLLAMPSFRATEASIPEEAEVSLTALARVARFLHNLPCDQLGADIDSIHWIGENDRFCSVDDARRLNVPVRMIVAAGHELNQSSRAISAIEEYVACSPYGKSRMDPGVRYVLSHRVSEAPADMLDLSETAPPPARADIEITTRCQFSCPRCARTLYGGRSGPCDMPWSLFHELLEQMTYVGEIIFVGLGEPLLHPALPQFSAAAASQGIRVRVVTNGVLATQERLRRLKDSGISEVTFSIDSAEPERFSRLRGGAPYSRVLENIERAPAEITTSVFVTLSRDNVGDLKGVIEIARRLGLSAVAVSDVNFLENQPMSLNQSDVEGALAEAIRYACEEQVLLIGPHFHNLPDVRTDYRYGLVRIPADLMGRAACHQNCLSPWRIAVVGVDGAVAPCNCSVNHAAGNVVTEPLDAIWNGSRMRDWRGSVIRGRCAACHSCPRY